AAIVFMASITLFNAVLVVISVANAFGASSFGMFLLQETNPLLVNGDLVGDEIYRFVFGVLTGNLSVAAILIGMSMLLEPRAGQRYWLWLVLIICTLGTIIGYSRQSLISALGGLLVLAFYIIRRRRAGKLVGLVVAIIIICVITLF